MLTLKLVGKLLEIADELPGTSNKHLQKQTKTRPTNFAQKSNSFAYRNSNSSLFPVPEMLPDSHCFLQPRQTCTAKTCQKSQRALGNVTECRSVVLLLVMQSPATVLVSVLTLGMKDIAVQQDNSVCELFQVTLVYTPQYCKSQADFSLLGCLGNTRWLSYWE